jgi:glycosyltransferase involved in cell wall biosynthesis
LANALAEKGHRVAHLSSPVSILHLARWWTDARARERLRSWLEGIQRTEAGAYEGVPFALLPGRVNLQSAFETNLMLKGMIPSLRTMLCRMGIEEVDVVFIDQPSYFNIQQYVPVKKVVYRPTDVYTVVHDLPAIDRVERKIIDGADGVVATSQPVLDHLQAAGGVGVPSRVIHNGVEYGHFQTEHDEPDEYASIPEPRTVYIGAIDQRFDWELIVRTAQARPDTQFVLIGRESPGTAIGDGPENVHFLGVRPYSDLPGYLQHAHVGLLPANDHTSNEGRSPMKVYEYMAAGLEVVARKTEELQRRSSSCVHLYESPEEFGTLVDEAVQATGDDRERCREQARSESWNEKADELMRFLNTL